MESERVVDARLDVFDGPESSDDLLKFGRWLTRAARWQKKGFTLVELLVVLAIVAIVVSLLLGAVRGSKASPGDSIWLRTVRHDGHMWVVNGSAEYFVHHPDCDRCSKGERQP